MGLGKRFPVFRLTEKELQWVYSRQSEVSELRCFSVLGDFIVARLPKPTILHARRRLQYAVNPKHLNTISILNPKPSIFVHPEPLQTLNPKTLQDPTLTSQRNCAKIRLTTARGGGGGAGPA